MYIYSTMARKKHCPVCDGDHFKKVVVTLPSGKPRETELVYCCRCELTFFRPKEDWHLPPPPRPVQPPPSVPTDIPFLARMPADDIAIAWRMLPDVDTATDDVQYVTVDTPSQGKVRFRFERMTAKHYTHRHKFWVAAHAEKGETPEDGCT